MKTTCVIGGGGFIGAHIVNNLISKKRKVIVIDKNPLSLVSYIKNVEYIVGDFNNKNLLSKVFKKVEDIIVLAYSGIPKTSFEDPVKDILENLPPIVRLFSVASEFKIEKIIFISSGGTVYGEPELLPITESHATNPISPYGITKLTTEKYAFIYHKTSGLPITCARPGNAFGEGQKPFIGQGFIASAIASILKGKEICVFGSLDIVRDYVYVTDIASGIIAVLDQGRMNQCYNIGTGIGKSIDEVLSSLFNLAKPFGFKPKIKILPKRSYDVSANILDSTKIFKDTGWKVNISFEDGLKKTWDWMYGQYISNNLV